jgi:predicted RNA-binding protein with PUA-like domain
VAYWLFKSEPGCFSFNDLKQRPGMIEPWDGVRNFQARNFLRDSIRIGDRVLFYHSNCPEPAIVGLAEVVRAGYPDTTALNPGSPHFDPRATIDNPVWYMVDVRYTEPLPKLVTLQEIKRHPLLADMLLAKRSRLSIQPVSDHEWGIILTMGGAVCR